ncbi:MAG TPA: phosphoribosylanthranilate isomerase [Steroidobacteraceae bacterium]|nr:phosphoribosylanthranilate isomerase [Steroidobacteraceae bacterium]
MNAPPQSSGDLAPAAAGGGFVKICGMNDARAVEAALAAQVDALGFVFARSVRQVTPRQAVELARPARGRALCVAVMQHPSTELLELVLEIFHPDVVQTDREDFLRFELPAGVAGWPVLRDRRPDGTPVALLRGQRLLFEGTRSGSGEMADWSVARALSQHCELILAGGLSPANVEGAITAVRPFGVDVSSGVEEAPGRKSPALIESFVSRARQAFARPAQGEH